MSLEKQFIDGGMERMMIGSESITANVKTWRTEVIQSILKDLPIEKVMFEAADLVVFNWYLLKNLTLMSTFSWVTVRSFSSLG